MLPFQLKSGGIKCQTNNDKAYKMTLWESCLLMLLSGWFLTYLARGSQEVPTSLILNGGYWIGFIMMGIGVFNFFLQIMEL